MRLTRTLAAIVAPLLVAAPTTAAAQEPVRSFDQLNTRLKPGDTIWITDAQGREVKGRIQALAPEGITLRGDGPKTFAAGDVTLIQERRHDSLANGALIGLAVGGVGTGVACLATTGEGPDEDWCLVAALVYGGIGTAIGVGIDALIPGKKLVAYRAPGPTGAAAARLSFAPVVTPRAKGVVLSFAF
jgi:hypothetical protein